MESGIQKCGYLKIKRPPTSGKVRIKAWQMKYFVLRNVPPIFEYFKDELSFNLSRHTKEKNKINLENVIHIGTTDASKKQRNAFMIVDSEHGAIMLATDSEQETKDWVDMLNKVSGRGASSATNSPNMGEFTYPENQSTSSLSSLQKTSTLGSPESVCSPSLPSENFQGFNVTTRLTPSSEKLGIRDDYTMYITNDNVAIHEIDTNVLVVQWPIVGLRGWKSEPADAAGRRCTQLLTLEAGRKSSTGEGLYQFFTDKGDQIANNIRGRSNALCATAVREKREKFKDKSNSFEDISQDDPSKAKPFVRSSSSAASLILSQKTNFRERSASDNNIVFPKLQNSSPQSLRKELLQDKFTKDIAKNIKPILEDSNSSTQTADNTYLDLINDADAVPIHIADSDHQKSVDSLSQISDEEIVHQKTLINTVHETNGGQNYIDDSELNDYRKKTFKTKSLDNKNLTGHYADPKQIKRTEAHGQKQTPPPSNTLCQDFLDQLSNPQSHLGNIFQEKQNSTQEKHTKGVTKTENTETSSLLAGNSNQSANNMKNESTASQTANVNCLDSHSSSEELSNDLDQEEKDGFISMRKPQTTSVSEKRVFPHGKEEAMDLLEKLVLNLETPQACTQERIFPPRREDKLEKTILTTSEAPQTQSNVRRADFKRTIEKSKSHCGFETAQQTDKPPPLPVRPEMGRTKPSASLGDITKDLTRPLDFHKDLHRQLSPWNTNTPALGAPWGPESVVHARLLHRSTSGSSLGAVREAHQALRHVEKSSSPLFDRTRSQSSRGSIDSPPPIQENETFADDDDGKKRRGSKASTFISRVLNTLNPDSKRRASCDIVSSCSSKEFDAAKRGRSCSVVPGGIVNEGWSPEHSLDVPSPEGSPQNFRKLLPGARRLSHDPNLDRSRKLFVGSPTFENRSKEEIRQKEKAKERERERSELPNEPPPQLPPRKKSDPPPLPPRIRKSSSDSCGSGPSSPKSRQPSDVEEATPPPIPPRRLDDRRGSQPAPAIHLTASSPSDEKSLESILPDLNAQDGTNSTLPGASRTKPPDDDLTSKSLKGLPRPIPLRPEPQTSSHKTCAREVNEISKTSAVRQTDKSFTSIEMQQKTGEKLPECESNDGSSNTVSNQATGSPQGNSGNTRRYSPGHTPPLALNLQSHNGGMVLGDSPTNPIKV